MHIRNSFFRFDQGRSCTFKMEIETKALYWRSIKGYSFFSILLDPHPLWFSYVLIIPIYLYFISMLHVLQFHDFILVLYPLGILAWYVK